jgi:hypothetical protein
MRVCGPEVPLDIEPRMQVMLSCRCARVAELADAPDSPKHNGGHNPSLGEHEDTGRAARHAE